MTALLCGVLFFVGITVFLGCFYILLGYVVDSGDDEFIGDYGRRVMREFATKFCDALPILFAEARSLFVATPAEKRKRKERSPYDYDPYEKGE